MGSVPKDAQYPSCLFFSFGMDPSTTRMKGRSDLPSAASRNGRTNSSPTSYAKNGFQNLTFGIQGRAPVTMSSMLGWVAACHGDGVAVTAQPRRQPEYVNLSDLSGGCRLFSATKHGVCHRPSPPANRHLCLRIVKDFRFYRRSRAPHPRQTGSRETGVPDAKSIPIPARVGKGSQRK